MHATSLAVLSLVASVIATQAMDEAVGIGPPPALAPGQAPPPSRGRWLNRGRQIRLASRYPDRVGHPAGQSSYACSNCIGRKAVFRPRTRVRHRCLAPPAMIRLALSPPTAGPYQSGSTVGAGQRNAPTVLNALYNKTQFWDGRRYAGATGGSADHQSLRDGVGQYWRCGIKKLPATRSIRPNSCSFPAGE